MSEHFDSAEDRDIADSADEAAESGALEDERPDEGEGEAEVER